MDVDKDLLKRLRSQMLIHCYLYYWGTHLYGQMNSGRVRQTALRGYRKTTWRLT